VKPLQWNVYFERAMLKLRLGRNTREALDDFARCRRLEPHSALLCIREFNVWQAYDPVSGIPALREALRRDPSRAAEFFRGGVEKVHDHPELRPHFHGMAAADPKFLLAYLPYATPDEFGPLLEGLLASHPKLEMYTPEERLRFFELWYAKGDAAVVIRKLQENPEWRRDGWSVLAAHRAKQGDFQGAYEVAKSNVPPPSEGGVRPRLELSELVRTFNLNPTDILAGFDVAQAERREAKYQEALATLEQLAKLPHSPARVLYERGLTLAAKGDYNLAWEALRDYSLRLRTERKN
jgi:tetratricopeptide (TPR) repeat protein